MSERHISRHKKGVLCTSIISSEGLLHVKTWERRVRSNTCHSLRVRREKQFSCVLQRWETILRDAEGTLQPSSVSSNMRSLERLFLSTEDREGRLIVVVKVMLNPRRASRDIIYRYLFLNTHLLVITLSRTLFFRYPTCRCLKLIGYWLTLSSAVNRNIGSCE